MTPRAIAVACVLAMACTSERTVLELGDDVLMTCADVWQRGTAGAACDFDEACARVALADPRCCKDVARCTATGLAIETLCAQGCACTDDTGCAAGSQICTDKHCEGCPPIAACPRCPERWTRLERNGCPTCQCVPPVECKPPGGLCGAGADVCSPGQACPSGCGDPGASGSTCSPRGCPFAAPVGCAMACPDGMPCRQCAAMACECNGATWTCRPVCADGLTLACAFP